MAVASNVTPLIALDAAVIDTETTGLDPNKARIVEAAAVRVVHGRLDTAKTFRSLVNPETPIPVEAIRYHGIDQTAVAGAPPFAAMWPSFSTFIGDAVVIGHSVGFDLAIIKGECERAGIAWTRPRVLDTRLLAEAVQPNLTDYSLDALANLLGVEVKDRHSALGDAIITARVFAALLPKLRDAGVRTLAEALKTCHGLSDTIEAQHRAGWVEPVEAPRRTEESGALARIDSYPYRHRIRQVMSAPARVVPPETSVGSALSDMTRSQISSLFVAPAESGMQLRPEQTGIVTERDVLRALDRDGGAGLAMPVASLASRPLATVPAEAFVYLAIARMNRLNIRHLGVTDEAGRVIGALSARDLLRLRAQSAVTLGDEIDHADDIHDLGRAWASLPRVASSLVAEQVPGRDVAAVISHMLGSLTQHAAVIAERRMEAEGRGKAPCAYALVVLGSAGREESLLAMDQDNAIVFAEGAPDGEEDRWFAALGTHVADILHEVGVPYCIGGVMAKNAQWRGSLATWQDRVRDWIRRSNPQDLLSVDIFFDLRAVHGDTNLANTLWRSAFDAARGEVGFAKLLAEAAGTVSQSLGLFGRFKTEAGRINLKRAGLFGIVSMARVLAIRHHVVERSTPARLAGLKALGLGAGRDLDTLAEAQATFLDLILAQQIDDIEHGIPATNDVVVKRLSRRDRDRLRDALSAVGNLDVLTRDLLFRG
jgi:DNA polymerase-3 subunit epsilon/CBS domain-containing protein